MKKEKNFLNFHEFLDVFAWSYKDLKGFDPSIVSHAIHLKKIIHANQIEINTS